MISPLILVAGTFAFGKPDDRTEWWHPDSDFGRAAVTAGLSIDREPFIWSTALDGLAGQDKEWNAAGAALRYFAHYKYPPTIKGLQRVSIFAHSHGGQVAIYAAAQGLLIDVLVTMGTPVRQDMEPFRRLARQNTKRWVHLYSSHDPVQLEGEVGGGGWNPLSWPREMPEASENIDARTTEPNAHGKLHDSALWTSREWWSLLQS